MKIPFVGSKDPVAAAEAKAARYEAKQAEAVARFERSVRGKQASWEAKAKLREVKEKFRAEHPEIKTAFGQLRAGMGKVGAGLDSLSAATFVRVADRGILLAIVASIVVAFGLDIFFFGTKASDWFLGPLFILLAISARLIAICAGVMLEALKSHKSVDKRALRMWRFIWAVAVFICFMSEVSFFVAKGDKLDVQKTGIASIASTASNSVDDQIAALQAQQAAIRADRDTNIATLQRSIDGIVHDKSDKNDHEADPYRADQAAERESARSRIAAIDASITDLIASKGSTNTGAVQQQAAVDNDASTSWAVFSWFSGRTGAAQRDVVDVGMLTIAMFLMLVVAFGPGAYFSIHRMLNGFSRKLAASEAEEAAELDAEIAAIQKRTELARAAAAAARTQDLNDDEEVLRQAQELVEDARRAKALAEAEAEARRLREEAEAIRNGVPLTKKQQDSQNGGHASDLAKKTKDQIIKIPVGAWSTRSDRVERAA